MQRTTAAALTLGIVGTVMACGSAGRFSSVLPRNLGALFTVPRRVPHRITRPFRSDSRLAVLWIGHATTLIQIDDRVVLTDPVFTSAVGQLSPRLVEPGIAPENVPPTDAVLISHMHFDHLSPGSLAVLAPVIRRLFVPEGGTVYIPPYDFPVTALRRWERWEDRGLSVTAVPVQHVGWRYGADQAWMTRSFTGYVVQYHGLTVYYGGDTGYVRDYFTETARRFPHIDLAVLPIGPIHPRDLMRHNHMDPGEALQAFLDLGADIMVPIHFDTFINSTDTLGECPAVLREAITRRGVLPSRVAILDVGEQRVVIPRALPGS